MKPKSFSAGGERPKLLRAVVGAAFLLALRLIGAESSLVPEWFHKDPAKPFAIFEAWRHLSTREASICTGPGWDVLGGILCDPNGKPLPSTTVELSSFHGRRWGAAEVTSDVNGYFLVYGSMCRDIKMRLSVEEKRKLPFREQLNRMDSGCELTACPGYPGSRDGWAYAESQGEVRDGRPKLLMEQEDRVFYQFTVDARNSFTPVGFAQFKAKYYAKLMEEPFVPWHPQPRHREKESSHTPTIVYRLRIFDDHRKPLPKTVVTDGWEVVETDTRGYCSIERTPLTPKDLHLPVNYTSLSVDVPGGVVGPIQRILQPNVLNVIKLPPPATVSGKLLDQNDRPVAAWIYVEYEKPNDLAFEPRVPLQPDGSFCFSGLMPGERFRLLVERPGQSPFAPTWTAYYYPPPRPKPTNLVIRVARPAALRGVVVDRSGKGIDREDVTLIFQGDFYRSDPMRSEPEASGPGRFGFESVNQNPFRIRVLANGFRDYLSPETRLEPGELRFLQITLEASYVKSERAMEIAQKIQTKVDAKPTKWTLLSKQIDPKQGLLGYQWSSGRETISVHVSMNDDVPSALSTVRLHNMNSAGREPEHVHGLGDEAGLFKYEGGCTLNVQLAEFVIQIRSISEQRAREFAQDVLASLR